MTHPLVSETRPRISREKRRKSRASVAWADEGLGCWAAGLGRSGRTVSTDCLNLTEALTA
eukprot:1906340-Rhodomonas_salina.1